ncbi:ABC transporter ATP-binding protein [Afifella sp. IM 167]|uniref:ABC transporter ATP-binding protein n=1 Tax=Afifella sp. IM 167 TaxID=2033586 RepID=UPI001CCC77FE|nr:ABC transporter ATP-binding protein [Afifella sp. IM 167]
MNLGSAIHIEGVKKSFGAHVALQGVDVEIPAGSFTAILGPSGCGKTTLLMTIAGFEHPEEGRIRFDAHEVTAEPPERRNVGLVFQSYALFPHMSVADNIAYALRARRRPKAEIADKVKAVAALMEVEPLLARLPSEISGGQRQRVAIARALVFDPHILLLDEPLSALDRNLRDRMKDELRRIHRKLGITIVIVTHDQDEATELADQIIVMDSGRVLAAGPPRALYEQPRSAEIARFFGRANIFKVAGNSEDAVHVEGSRLDAATVSGEGAQILVRPEDFEQVEEDREDAIRMLVEAVTFRAGLCAVTCKAPSGAPVLAELPTGRIETLAKGDAFYLRPRKAWLLD